MYFFTKAMYHRSSNILTWPKQEFPCHDKIKMPAQNLARLISLQHRPGFPDVRLFLNILFTLIHDKIPRPCRGPWDRRRVEINLIRKCGSYVSIMTLTSIFGIPVWHRVLPMLGQWWGGKQAAQTPISVLENEQFIIVKVNSCVNWNLHPDEDLPILSILTFLDKMLCITSAKWDTERLPCYFPPKIYMGINRHQL